MSKMESTLDREFGGSVMFWGMREPQPTSRLARGTDKEKYNKVCEESRVSDTREHLIV